MATEWKMAAAEDFVIKAKRPPKDPLAPKNPKTAAVLRRRPFASLEAVGAAAVVSSLVVAAPAAVARRGCRGCRAWGGATSAAAAPLKARTSAGVRRIILKAFSA